MSKEIKYPKIFKLDDDTYRVKQKKMYQTKFKDAHAYVLSEINGFVYPYRGEIQTREQAFLPGIYICNNEVIIKRPVTDEDRIKYSMDRIIELTPDSIFKDLNEYISDIKEPIIMDGDIFKPEINDTDDILLAGMKYCIGNKNGGKGISFNSYGHRFSDVATKNNARRAITHGESLKMSMASRYADVFDIKIGAIFWDKKNCQNPMDPNYNTVYCIFNDDQIDLKDKNIKFKVITKETNQ